MLSLAWREDARKGVGIEVFKRRGEMEESELEEGEASSSKEDDGAIDPDIALSYIDDKIRDVLGHFQKDFEGGGSTENLGRKICDYGSFLPANQCLTPTSSQSGCLQKLPFHITSRPPYGTSSEKNLIIHANTLIPLKKDPIPKASHLDSRSKNKERLTCQTDLGASDSKAADQKTLKLRIKVGPETKQVRPNASIYSVMGLEYSPSSSPDSPHESPMTVCQIMTCSLVPAEDILSPLHESILQLMPNDTSYIRDPRSTVCKPSLEACSVLGDDPLSSWSERNCSSKTIKKSKIMSLNNRGNVIGTENREISSETTAGRELVSVVVDAPKQSYSSRISNDFGDETIGGCDKVTSKVKLSSSTRAKDEPLVRVSLGFGNSGCESPHLKCKPNSKASLTDEVLEEIISQHKGAPLDSPAGEKADGLNVKKDVNSKSDELSDGDEHQGPKLHGKVSEKSMRSRNQSPGSRRKSGNQMNIMQPVESSRKSSKTSSESKKRSHTKVDHSELRKKPLAVQDSKKVHDAAEDVNSEKLASIVDPSDILLRDKLGNGIDHSIGKYEFSDWENEKTDVKVDQNPSSFEEIKIYAQNNPLMPDGLSPKETPAPAAILVKEDWVCCDKCQKWRLLPYGTNPDQLPKKWLCTMQVWLPGLNKCSVSEEETTRALHASYQAPLAESHTAKGLITSSQAADKNLSYLVSSGHAKKKLTLKAGRHAPGDSPQPSDSAKKSQSFSDANCAAPQLLVRSSQLPKVEFKDESKNTQKRCDQCPDNVFTDSELLEKNSRPSKSKGNRGSDQDGSRVLKKFKAEVVSDHDSSERLVAGYDKNSSNKPPKIGGSLKDDDSSLCKNVKFDLKSGPHGASKKPLSSGSCPELFSNFDKENFNKGFSAKKRKSEGGHDSDAGNGLSVEEMYGESGSRKEKRSRSPSKERMSTIHIDEEAKGMLFNGREEKNKCTEHNERQGSRKSGLSSRQILDYVDSEKKDLPRGNTSAGALSSSSKVSGSCKSKSNIQEARGSPVESVSSSPLRASNGDYLSRERDNPHSFDVHGSTNGCHSLDSAFWDPAEMIHDYQDQRRTIKGSFRSREKHQSSNSEVHVNKGKKSNTFLDKEEVHSGKDERKRESRGRQSNVGRNKMQENVKCHYLHLKQEGESTYASTKVGNPPLVQGPVDVLAANMGDKGEKHVLNNDNRHGQQQHISFMHPTPNRLDGPSPLRKDSNHSAAASLLKEARDLKHTADRLKNDGVESESTGLYFEAALKFLHVASLRETSCADGETTPSMEMYSSTAKLCEFCGYLYEKHKELAAAALAYKCMEVANMKVVFFKDSGASKDRNELHSALLLVPAGESPSSSASDIDNLTNQNAGDKAAPGKSVSSPHGYGNHVISARNRPSFVRLLSFVQDVHDAMEASRRSLCAFNAINGVKTEEVVASVKQALAHSFHDVEGLLRLVRLSMDSISR